MQQVAEFSRRFQLSQSVSSQAQEYYRLAEVKGVLSLRGVSGPCLALICLEIACNQHGEPLDKKQVQKLSGLQPKPYSSALHSVEKMLDLSTHVSLRELAVRFGCLEAEHLANEILQNYKEKMDLMYTDAQKESLDPSKPLYSAASLYTACKLLKIRSDRAQFQSVANCTSRVVFQSVLDQMSECAPKNASDLGKSKRKRKQKETADTANDDAEPKAQDHRRESQSQCRPKRWQRDSLNSRALSSPFSEDYLTWKERTLAQARAKLASGSQIHSN